MRNDYNRQYVGARYVARPMGEWDRSASYEALSVVTYLNSSYISKIPVPHNIDILNDKYWVFNGNVPASVNDAINGLNYLSALTSKTYISFADMVNDNQLKQGDYASFKGGLFTIGKDDGLNIETKNGYLVFIGTSIEPLMLGAKGDGTTDDTVLFQKTIDYAQEKGINIELSTNYAITNIVITKKVNIDCKNNQLNGIGSIGNMISINIPFPEYYGNYKISNLNLYTVSNYDYVLNIAARVLNIDSVYIKSNCSAINIETYDGVFINYAKITHLSETPSNTGLNIAREDTTLGCIEINGYANGIIISPNESVSIYSAHIWGCNYGMIMKNGVGGYFGELTLDSCKIGIDIQSSNMGFPMFIAQLFLWNITEFGIGRVNGITSLFNLTIGNLVLNTVKAFMENPNTQGSLTILSGEAPIIKVNDFLSGQNIPYTDNISLVSLRGKFNAVFSFNSTSDGILSLGKLTNLPLAYGNRRVCGTAIINGKSYPVILEASGNMYIAVSIETASEIEVYISIEK